jgi:hypothetical protein
MPYSNALEGLRSKLFRAKDHFTDLDVSLGQVLDGVQPNNSESLEPQSDGQLVFKMGKLRPLDPRIALIVGDCIHNTRSVLDHLVGQLAILNNCPKALTKTAFPVCLTQPEFAGIAKTKVAPFVSAVALTEIEKLQPYSTGNGANDLLWVLHQLDIIDKHRVHIVAKHKVRPIHFTVMADNGQVLSLDIPDNGPWKSAEDDAELLRFQIVKDVPFPVKVNVEVKASFAIQIEETGLFCDGGNLLTVLHDFIGYVGRIVDDFGGMFFGE